jgi:hypothetical protein
VKQHGYKGAKELAPFGKPSLLQQMAILIWVRLDIRQQDEIAKIARHPVPWNVYELVSFVISGR